VLLSFILQKAFNRSYSAILDKYIVDPVKLINTYYGGNINTLKNEAKSYRMKSDWEVEPEGDMSIPLGAGGIVSTPTDLCRFAQALFSGKLITKESLQKMKPTDDDSYGFALYATPFSDKKAWGHGGNIDAFSSDLICFEEENICIALSCNGSNFGIHDIAIAIMSELFTQPYDLPSFEYQELSDDELDLYLGTYVTDDLPMDMIFTKKDKTLYLEVTGQDRRPIQSVGDHKFTLMQLGVKIEFFPEEKRMHFEQQGYAFDLTLQENTEKEEVKEILIQDLSPYLGTYTSDELPIDITISENQGKLIAKGQGQPSFELNHKEGHIYRNKEIGLSITFYPEQGKIDLLQGGAVFEMVLTK